VGDLLVGNPDERATAEEAAASTWLNRRYGATVRAPTEEELDIAVSCLSSYSHYAKLKKLVRLEGDEYDVGPVKTYSHKIALHSFVAV
jgi:hypothetical protein